MNTQDQTVERILAESWLARRGPRWSFSVIFVLVVLFALKPLIIDRLLSRAEAYSSCGLYNNAIRECKKVLSLDAENPLAFDIMGVSYKSQGDLDNAVNTYLEAVNADPTNRVAHFKVAMIFVLRQNYKRAIPYFEQVRALGPESHDALSAETFSYYRSALEMLALCYERTDDPGKNAVIREELARNYPDYSRAMEKLNALRHSAQPGKNL